MHEQHVTYTTTPHEAFILDRRGSLVLDAGFLLQGAKFTPCNQASARQPRDGAGVESDTRLRG